MSIDEPIQVWMSYDDYGDVYYISDVEDRSPSTQQVTILRSQFERLKEIKNLHLQAVEFVMKQLGMRREYGSGGRETIYVEPEPDEKCLFG